MAKPRKHTPEQIVNILRQIEVAVANGKTHPAASREAGITEQTYYRRRKKYGGLKVDQAKRLKELEQENGKPHGDESHAPIERNKVSCFAQFSGCNLSDHDNHEEASHPARLGTRRLTPRYA